MGEAWWDVGVIAVLMAVIGFGLGHSRKRPKSICFARVSRDFHFEREWLEAKFIQSVTTGAHCDAARWADCTFDDDVAYVRNRTTGELSALVAVTVTADSHGLSMHGNTDAIGNLQVGTAVFRFDGQHWVTDGRAILNLNPRQTVQQFRNDIEMVAEDPSHRTV